MLIDFLRQQILRRADIPLDEDTPLVSSGLVDSFALVDIIGELENVTNSRIPVGKVSPQDLDTVRKMLDTAKRLGVAKPAPR